MANIDLISQTGSGTVQQRAENSQFAARVSLRPMDVLAWASFGLVSGAMAGIAAGATIFSLRNIGTNNLLLRRFSLGAVTAVAFTAPQRISYLLSVARAFTASDSSGTAIAASGNNAKLRTSLAQLSNVDMRISAAAALTAGTRTVDANSIGAAIAWSGGAGSTIVSTADNVFGSDAHEYPLILAQNEGIVLLNNDLMGAAGVVNIAITFAVAELTPANF